MATPCRTIHTDGTEPFFTVVLSCISSSSYSHLSPPLVPNFLTLLSYTLTLDINNIPPSPAHPSYPIPAPLGPSLVTLCAVFIRTSLSSPRTCPPSRIITPYSCIVCFLCVCHYHHIAFYFILIQPNLFSLIRVHSFDLFSFFFSASKVSTVYPYFCQRYEIMYVH